MKKSITIRNLLLISMLGMLLAGAFAVWKNFVSRSPEELFRSLPENIDIAFGEVDYTETRGERRLWRLQAARVAREARQQKVQLEDVRMTLYQQGELGNVHLTAYQGWWFPETGNVELMGEVHVRGDGGLELFCDQLFFDNKAELVFSESPVRLLAEGMETTGVGLEFSLLQRRVVILDQVHARFSGW